MGPRRHAPIWLELGACAAEGAEADENLYNAYTRHQLHDEGDGRSGGGHWVRYQLRNDLHRCLQGVTVANGDEPMPLTKVA